MSGPTPKATNIHDVVESKNPIETYHITWSPDMKYLTFTRGPKFKGREPEGPVAGVSRSRGAGLERVRGRRDAEEPLGRHHQRRQVVQATELGRGQGRGGEMMSRKHAIGRLPHVRGAGSLWAARRPALRRPPATLPTIKTQSGVEMVSIPAGFFEMGSRHGRDEEKPVHKVWIDSFLMDRHEVTQAEYEKLGKIEAFPNPSHFQGADLPVEQVTWPQAARFCNARSRFEGLQPCYNEDTGACDFEANGYRLPTEAEWEYACRAGTNADYSFGDEARPLGDFAWFADNSGKKTHPVGQKKPNPWGLFDMHGNVAEWCQDVYDPNYYKSSPEKEPARPGRRQRIRPPRRLVEIPRRGLAVSLPDRRDPRLLRRLPGPRRHRLPLRAQGAVLEGCRIESDQSCFIRSRQPCSSIPGSSSSSS